MFEFECCRNGMARWTRGSVIGLCAGMIVALVGCNKSSAKADEKAADAKPAAASATPAGDAKAFTQVIPGSKVAFKMVPIPAGKFTMGSPVSEKKRQETEGPQFSVEVEPFWMGECEVTQAEYELYLENYQRLAEKGAPAIPKDKLADAVTYPTPMYELEAGPVFTRMGRGGKFPAVIMSQYAARQYTKWLSKRTGRFYRLPTEAEWEYACRAGTTTAYSFGDDPKKLDEYGWYIDNSDKGGDTAYREVGQKKPNPWGLYDMHGNVAEWCIDAFRPDWYKQFTGKTVKASEVTNWPTELYPRIIRGGSYQSDPEECRSAFRYPSAAKLNVKDPQLPQSPHWLSDGFWVGFRIVSPAKEPPDLEKTKYWDADDELTRRVLERDREIREIPPQVK
jgi:formylglycine-generating enzyme required for sulfatase activity